ncbi:MAG: hypothetical protein ACMUHY_00900 [Thermoplasmatota archaeon]
MNLPGPGHPMVVEMEGLLENLIGVLSRFIVERSYMEVTGGGSLVLDHESANSMCESILEETSLLVGPRRANELNEQFERMIGSYFKEGEKK